MHASSSQAPSEREGVGERFGLLAPHPLEPQRRALGLELDPGDGGLELVDRAGAGVGGADGDVGGVADRGVAFGELALALLRRRCRAAPGVGSCAARPVPAGSARSRSRSRRARRGGSRGRGRRAPSPSPPTGSPACPSAAAAGTGRGRRSAATRRPTACSAARRRPRGAPSARRARSVWRCAARSPDPDRACVRVGVGAGGAPTGHSRRGSRPRGRRG